MDSQKLERLSFSRRCFSEPPLAANRRPSSTITQHTCESGTQSLQDIKQTQFPREKLKTSSGFRGNAAVRSSTFPLLPALGDKNMKFKDMGLRSINTDAHHNEKFPSFKTLRFNNPEKILTPKHTSLQGRKYQLQSRYITEKKPTPPKQPATRPTRSYPLRKRVQEIKGLDYSNTKMNNEEVDEISELYLNSGCQSNLRRLSVITEKSNFSKSSTKTKLFDLEEDSSLQMSSQLPGIEKDFQATKRQPDNIDKHSRNLQEHLKITGKQFNPLETKAKILSNWFQTLQSG